MKKIDVFNHIWPKPFHDALIAHVGETTDITRRSEAVPMMTDLDKRFEVMDLFGEDYCQILSLASPPFEKYADAAKSLELAQIASDGMAELCQKYPDRFPGFIGTAVLNNPDAMVEEARRNI
ncbi:MAG TPA: amidohydrolase, partial [Rhodobacteraceae bacterium]|nr:amidohydrolase [Paracoccaceae bacterium]